MRGVLVSMDLGLMRGETRERKILGVVAELRLEIFDADFFGRRRIAQLGVGYLAKRSARPCDENPCMFRRFATYRSVSVPDEESASIVNAIECDRIGGRFRG